MRHGAKANKRLLVTLGILAVITHAASLFTHLMTPAGLELDFFSAASLIAVAVIAVVAVGGGVLGSRGVGHVRHNTRRLGAAR